jgi:tetratricopeptide (TPR) repeat protein
MTHIDEIERLPAFGMDSVWRPVRHHFGIEAFGINAYTADAAGKQVVEEHDELQGAAGGHQELYVVLSGRAAFTIEGEQHEARAGTLVFLGDPAARRSAIALEPGTTVLAIGGEPGHPYAVSAWEFAFRGLARGGQEGAEIFADGIARYPDRASLYYNLACMHALDGDRGPALEALRRAIELNPEARDWARADDDLSELRGSEGFDELVRGAEG